MIEQHDIAFLHTSEVHIETFQKLVESIEPNVRVRHEVNEALLKDAIDNGLSEALTSRVHFAMQHAADSQAKVVVCTCSTIGGIAELTPLPNSISMRIDRPMADLAVRKFQDILVIAALDSTLQPTSDLLQQSIINTPSTPSNHKSPKITLKKVPMAWEIFLNGDIDGYINKITDFIHTEKSHYDCVVLAQASMAPAAIYFENSDICVLASPKLGVQTALEKL